MVQPALPKPPGQPRLVVVTSATTPAATSAATSAAARPDVHHAVHDGRSVNGAMVGVGSRGREGSLEIPRALGSGPGAPIVKRDVVVHAAGVPYPGHRPADIDI